MYDIDVHCTNCTYCMVGNVYMYAHLLPSVVCEHGEASGPVAPIRPGTETELDCLRTVDTCTNSMILNCLCAPIPSRGTNKTFKASTAVGVNRERPFYRSLLSAVVHYTESVVAGIKGRMNIFIRRVAKDRTHSSDTQGPVVLRMSAQNSRRDDFY